MSNMVKDCEQDLQESQQQEVAKAEALTARKTEASLELYNLKEGLFDILVSAAFLPPPTLPPPTHNDN